MATTARIKEDANALLEFYIGYKRMNGERIKKEDVVAQFITQGIRAALPPEALALFAKGISAKPLRKAR